MTSSSEPEPLAPLRQFTLHFSTAAGPQPLVTFTERPGGHWELDFMPRDDQALVEKMISRVSLYQLRRAVLPDEGDLYLEALKQTFVNSSRYILTGDDFVAAEPPRVDIYRRGDTGETLLGSIRLNEGEVTFDEGVEWVRTHKMPPGVTPADGVKYLRTVFALFARGTYLYAALVNLNPHPPRPLDEEPAALASDSPFTMVLRADAPGMLGGTRVIACVVDAHNVDLMRSDIPENSAGYLVRLHVGGTVTIADTTWVLTDIDLDDPIPLPEGARPFPGIDRSTVTFTPAAASPVSADVASDEARVIAFGALTRWLEDSGSTVGTTTLSDWAVSAYQDAVVFAPVQKRSNTVYLVRGDTVVFYMPSSEGIEDAYARFVGEVAPTTRDFSAVLRSAIPTTVGGVQLVLLSLDGREGSARLVVLDDPENPDGRLVELLIGEAVTIGGTTWMLKEVNPHGPAQSPEGAPGSSNSTVTLTQIIVEWPAPNTPLGDAPPPGEPFERLSEELEIIAKQRSAPAFAVLSAWLGDVLTAEGMAIDNEINAGTRFIEWTQTHHLSPGALVRDEWASAPLYDAWLFGPAGQQASFILFLVRGSLVRAFSIKKDTVEQAYKKLLPAKDSITLSSNSSVWRSGPDHVSILSTWQYEEGKFNALFAVWGTGVNESPPQRVGIGGTLHLTESDWTLVSMCTNPEYRERPPGGPPGGPGRLLLTLERVR